jgi:hypothetical protein
VLHPSRSLAYADAAAANLEPMLRIIIIKVLLHHIKQKTGEIM